MTYERWASTTPDDFRFAVKMPKAVTHGARLTGAEDILDRFLDEALGLGRKLGPLLVQLPPSLLFDAPIVTHFLGMLRSRHAGDFACEPRHASWFAADADALLASHRVARVAADPAAGSPLAARPGGWQGFTYLRLHGSPRIYRSAYEPVSLKAAASTLRAGAEAGDAWCILDNTAEFAALGDALALKTLITDP